MELIYDQDDDSWSDTSSEDDEPKVRQIQPRAYQLEMFQHSMERNIIATMETGSGKTQIAKLRIEAELQRTPGKRVWFTAPSVVLAQQQYFFLSSQLSAHQFKLLTGMDNVDFWSTQEVWDAVLCNIDVVVSTPQVLLDALTHGFVNLQNLSLLVFDEAHHCVAAHPFNQVMQTFYHSLPQSGPRPHILGLSASPITNDKSAALETLERNMDAVCRAPVLQLQDYQKFVHIPALEKISFNPNPHGHSRLMTELEAQVNGISADQDPLVQKLRDTGRPGAQAKAATMLRTNTSPAIKQLRSLLRVSEWLHEDLGSWAADAFVIACLEKLHEDVRQGENWVSTMVPDEKIFMDNALQPVRDLARSGSLGLPEGTNISPKVHVLIRYLLQGYQPNLMSIIFVKMRATAWALTALLTAHPATRRFGTFSFVGAPNRARQGLADLANLHVQDDAFADFRRGTRETCVATAVMEEGVDIPALNLVIRFDGPANFRSFIQSRGRARQPGSTFVMMHVAGDPAAESKKWEALEQEMKEQYMEDQRLFAEREAVESQDEACDRFFRVESTGATLTYNNARSHLQHFCATLGGNDELGLSQPTFIIEGNHGESVSAKVILPSSVPVSLQVTHGISHWQTEKMAKKDAAFEAYKKLHSAGLVNDSLLPPERPKRGHDDQAMKQREILSGIEAEYDPWLKMLHLFESAEIHYAHRIAVAGGLDAYPTLLLILPEPLLSTVQFPLYLTTSQQVTVSINAGYRVSAISKDLAQKVTMHLLTSILGRRMQKTEHDRLPFFLVPDIELSTLAEWYRLFSGRTPLGQLIVGGDLQQEEYLVRVDKETIPYVCRAPRLSGCASLSGERISRRLDFLSASTQVWTPILKELPVSNCSVDHLPAAYAKAIVLLPSITHLLEICLRAQAACEGPLRPLNFRNLDLVSRALTSPSASDSNYQRLEYLGDALLKYYTTIQVFVEFPNHPESHLSSHRELLITNARLQWATRELGLGTFITSNAFRPAQWNANVKTEEPGVENGKRKRKLPSKLLADIVESVLGAAFLDGRMDESSDARCISTLTLFIQDGPWKTPQENVSRYDVVREHSSMGVRLLAPVETMIGYTFANRALLAEALTQSGVAGAARSYERLEFLGDAILDRIVKERLYDSALMLDPGHMTARHQALLNRWTQSFFTLEAQNIVERVEIHTDCLLEKNEIEKTARTMYLPDYVRRVDSSGAVQGRASSLSAYLDVRAEILQAFESGKKFPWVQLLHVHAPKSYADVMESIIGAVFVDSQASLRACEQVLEKLGYMKLVRRLVEVEDLQVEHPIDTFLELYPDAELIAQRKGAHTDPQEIPRWRCKVVVDGRRIAHVRDAASREEAECRAAQRALHILSKMRRRDSGDMLSVHDSDKHFTRRA